MKKSLPIQNPYDFAAFTYIPFKVKIFIITNTLTVLIFNGTPLQKF